MLRDTNRICAVCGAEFVPSNARQKYCSDRCRYAAKRNKTRKEIELEAQADGARLWKSERWEKGLTRNVCRQCFRMDWVKEPTGFCSPECKRIWEVTNRMIINRKCPICHETFSTADRKRIYCSNYCWNQAKQRHQRQNGPEKEKREGKDYAD